MRSCISVLTFLVIVRVLFISREGMRSYAISLRFLAENEWVLYAGLPLGIAILWLCYWRVFRVYRGRRRYKENPVRLGGHVRRTEQPAAPRTSEGLRPHWEEKAACRDYNNKYQDPWDADPSVGHVNSEAHSFCGRCPVKRECLLAGLRSDALNNGVAFGIWGDTAPKHRRAMIRVRYRQACPVCKGKLVITANGEEWQACASCGITWRCKKRVVFTHGTQQPS
jgi:WhiB family redox-sensing transcriptional regulator